MEHPLSDPTLTRFLAESAESPEWLRRLDARGRPLALFSDGELNEPDRTLIRWVVSRFAREHRDQLLGLIGQRRKDEPGDVEPTGLANERQHPTIAGCDGRHTPGCFSLLRVCREMTERRNSCMLQRAMPEASSERVRPNPREMAEPLLTLTTMSLKERRAVWTAWNQGDAK